MSAYRLAVLQTITTINNRACYFRNLVVAVVVLTLASIGWAAVTWTFSPLAGLLLLLPTCGLFFFLDAKLLNDWRAQLLDGWVRKEIEFWAFCDAVSAIPMLPKDTLHSMLTTLPSAGDLLAEQGSSSSTREAAAALRTTMHACESDAMALKATAFAIATGSLITAAIFWMWQPTLGIIAIGLLPVLRKYMRNRRLGTLRDRTATATAKSDFDNEKYMELAAYLSWEPISVSEREAFLDSWSMREPSMSMFSRRRSA